MMLKRLSAAFGLAAFAIFARPASVTAEMLPAYSASVETIRGTISGFDGKYVLRVHDVRGYMDHVTMHDGTIINPTGLTLSEGMSVTVLGRTNGRTFDAAEIDTPYHYEQRVFTPVYITPAYGGAYYGYPGYGGSPYPYGYGAYPYGYPGYYGGYGGGSTIIIAPNAANPTVQTRPADPNDRFRSFHNGESRYR